MKQLSESRVSCKVFSANIERWGGRPSPAPSFERSNYSADAAPRAPASTQSGPATRAGPSQHWVCDSGFMCFLEAMLRSTQTNLVIPWRLVIMTCSCNNCNTYKCLLIEYTFNTLTTLLRVICLFKKSGSKVYP